MGKLIKIPVNIIKEKIIEKTGMSIGELDSKIKAKLEELSGLISEEGAAHIIANENGVKLVNTEETKVKIKNVYAGMRNIEVTGKVTAIYEVREFNSNGRQGKVGSFLIGDDTGMTRITAWGSKADDIKNLSEECIVKIKNGFSKENNGRIEIHLNDNSEIIVNPEGETVGEIKRGASSNNKTRKNIGNLQAGEENVEILATVVQTYDPNFWEVCPSCNKKAVDKRCNEHGEIIPDVSYVMNCFLDDGTDSIRTVFFKNQIQNLTGKTHDQIKSLRESGFEDLKNDLLGKIISVTGRVTLNEMFSRKEFVVQFVNATPDPKEEMKRLDENPAPQMPAVAVSQAEARVENVEPVTVQATKPVVEEIIEEDTQSSEDLMSLDDLEDIEDEDIYS